MNGPHPTRVLREEHGWILRVADVLEGLLALDHEATDYDAIGKCVTFFRLFADACHHGKEEGMLFPALEACGLPGDSGPIAVMLYEHRLGREAVAAKGSAHPQAREGDPGARARLLDAGRAYVDLIRAHIGKEDHVLFDMADEMVCGEARTGLCAAYDGTCAHTFEGCTKAQLEDLGREILAGRAPPGTGHPPRVRRR
jgi:hemerythrin-like domain-containing protein